MFSIDGHSSVREKRRSILIQSGRVCTIRESRGDDEMAACGQLGVDRERQAPMLEAPLQFERFLTAA